MQEALSTVFAITRQESESFARLSGDFNPLHLDSTAARRTQFGSTVAHGIHLLLRSLDFLFASEAFEHRTLMALSANFDTPVSTTTPITIELIIAGTTAKIKARAGVQTAFSCNLETRPAESLERPCPDEEFASATPDELDFPPPVVQGRVALKLSTSLLIELFPHLARTADTAWIADLLATTQVVGMHCPGMHSIYSGVKLRQRALPPRTASTLGYEITGTERRFHMLRMQVTGASLEGEVQALFRPVPVSQRPLRDIAELVSRGAFSGHRALVVGGSRGIGEVAAKILVAGDADVTLTYAVGKDDADRICAEGHSLSRACRAQPLDVLSLSSEPRPDWLSAGRFTHVYYFASPSIARNLGGWNGTLFDRFAAVYVASFAALVEQLLAARTERDALVHFFYPSSVFVAHPASGFAEYAVAKAAGEALCDQLGIRRGVKMTKPRLPRMRTDQTGSREGTDAADALPIMLNALRAMDL